MMNATEDPMMNTTDSHGKFTATSSRPVKSRPAARLLDQAGKENLQ